MSAGALEELIGAWSATYGTLSQAEIDERILGYAAIVRAIAERGAATATEFAPTAGLTLEQASDLFRGLAAAGVEFDDEGNLVGAALTVRRTPHRFHVMGRDLYAWCALDALFLPGLVGETAKVSSSCPVTGDSIRLTVSPDGVEERAPESTVLSVVVPQAPGSARKTGPASPT